MDRFQVTDKEGGPLLSELRSRRGIHAYLGLLAVGVDSAPGMERLVPIMVDRDRKVYVLYSLLTVSVGPYATKRRLLYFRGKLLLEGPPPIPNTPVAYLVV